VAERSSFYSPGIGSFETICLATGIGIAVGLIAGTTGLEGSARGRMTLLAGVLGMVAGFIAVSVLDGSPLGGTIVSGFFAGFACVVTSGVIAGATRRGGTAALGFLVLVAAVLIVVLTFLFKPFAIIPAVGLVWLAVSRRRRADRKHAGLRVLR
jgi:hypothetical protein